jgi:hypothetical protein
MYSLPESLDYLNFEFAETIDTIEFLLRIDRFGFVNLPGIFQVNIYPEEVFQMYSKMAWIRNQNKDFYKLLERYPPYPADVVGIIIEGMKDQIASERKKIMAMAEGCNGEFIGPEPMRDYYVNKNWTGNTKCHEDVSRQTTSWAEPFFLCSIEDYGNAKEIVEAAAVECGFEIGERFWARGTLRNGLLGYTACVTFDDTQPSERDRANRFVDSVLQEVAEMNIDEKSEVSIQFHQDVLNGLKQVFDPQNIMYPGILYLD